MRICRISYNIAIMYSIAHHTLLYALRSSQVLNTMIKMSKMKINATIVIVLPVVLKHFSDRAEHDKTKEEYAILTILLRLTRNLIQPLPSLE